MYIRTTKSSSVVSLPCCTVVSFPALELSLRGILSAGEEEIAWALEMVVSETHTRYLYLLQCEDSAWGCLAVQ